MAEESSPPGKDGDDDERPVAGTFFNPVPEKPASASAPSPAEGQSDSAADVDADGDGADAFDRSISELMRRRKAGPKASQPSTIGGVLTSKATGFGKPAAPRIIKAKGAGSGGKSKPFVGIGKPLNDVNNPQYDDQGYTLYADEETGKKSRVFEALVEYPCKFTMKIVGANEGGFAKDIVGVVAESCEVDVEDVENKTRLKGKWVSVTVQAPVKSAEMLYALYENIDRDPRVKFKF